MSVDGRGRTCTLRFRRPVPSPFGHVDVAPPTGLEPVTFCSTDSCSGRLSYGGVVRALGLEPSLVRGKSPVPYLSGVTRVVGREGIEPPLCRKTAGLQPAAPHGATDPCRSQVALASTTMSLQLSRCWCPDWLPGAFEAGSEGVEPPVVGFGDRDTAVARAQVKCAHDAVRVMRRSAEDQTESVGATNARRACRHWQAPVVPADPHDRGIGRVCTRARRSSTGIDPGAFVRR